MRNCVNCMSKNGLTVYGKDSEEQGFNSDSSLLNLWQVGQKGRKRLASPSGLLRQKKCFKLPNW